MFGEGPPALFYLFGFFMFAAVAAFWGFVLYLAYRLVMWVVSH